MQKKCNEKRCLRKPSRRKDNATMSLDPLTLLADAAPTRRAAKADFLTLLYVLMLATFTGLLVIRNVSRLLHTPLMSLTNAISAIAVVGSIMLAGRQETDFHHGPRRGGGVRLDDQHRQRLPAHRPDAQDVQEAGAGQVMNDNVIQPIYLVSAVLFILSLMWMNHPSTARRGVFAGVVAMVAAIGGTLLLPEIHSYRLDHHRACRRARCSACRWPWCR